MEKTCVESSQSPAAQWLRYWFPVIAYVTLIFYLSSLSHPEERLPNFLFEQLGDKLLHGIEYAVLAVLCLVLYFVGENEEPEPDHRAVDGAEEPEGFDAFAGGYPVPPMSSARQTTVRSTVPADGKRD